MISLVHITQGLGGFEKGYPEGVTEFPDGPTAMMYLGKNTSLSPI